MQIFSWKCVKGLFNRGLPATTALIRTRAASTKSPWQRSSQSLERILPQQKTKIKIFFPSYFFHEIFFESVLFCGKNQNTGKKPAKIQIFQVWVICHVEEFMTHLVHFAEWQNYLVLFEMFWQFKNQFLKHFRFHFGHILVILINFCQTFCSISVHFRPNFDPILIQFRSNIDPISIKFRSIFSTISVQILSVLVQFLVQLDWVVMTLKHSEKSAPKFKLETPTRSF